MSFFCISFIEWHYNLDEAQQLAKKDHKYILLNFSGSDWCGPCIQMHNEIFNAISFKRFADTTLVLVNADFPRKKKNQLPSKQQDLNNKMADQYNSQGKFPFTVLLDANVKIIKYWDGYPNVKPEAFVKQVKSIIDADR